MANIEDLMQGIEMVPARIVERTLTCEEARAMQEHEYQMLDKDIARLVPQFQLISQRAPVMLQLYDSAVLKGYSAQADKECAKQREGTCIPCFVSYPSEYPAWVRLNWGLGRLGRCEETQYENIIRAALELKGEESKGFFYSLRSLFEGSKTNAQEMLHILINQKLEDLPDDGEEELSPEQEEMFDLKESKQLWFGDLEMTRRRYQLMIDLTRKLST